MRVTLTLTQSSRSMTISDVEECGEGVQEGAQFPILHPVKGQERQYHSGIP